MNVRLFTPKKPLDNTASVFIDLYIDVYVKASLERLFNGEEPSVIYDFLELAVKICNKSYNKEISEYYENKDFRQYREIKELFIALGYLIHGTVEKNDLLMNALIKNNNTISVEVYNQLISEKTRQFITGDTLPRLKQLNDSCMRPNQPMSI
jgi:hypothetical protein